MLLERVQIHDIDSHISYLKTLSYYIWNKILNASAFIITTGTWRFAFNRENTCTSSLFSKVNIRICASIKKKVFKRSS